MSQHISAGNGICQENAIEIYIDDAGPLLIGHFLCRDIDADSCICVTEIQSAQFCHYLVDHGLYLILFGAVTLNRDYFASGLFCDLFYQFR